MNFNNSKKASFLQSFPEIAFNSENCDHAARCKFNFSYFDSSQEAGQDFFEWNHEQLHKLLTKLKEYGKHPLTYWMNQRCGGGGLKVFEVYGGFPLRSDFIHPKHIPKNVRWARFRLEGDMRLVGFLIPSELAESVAKNGSFVFDSNAFYAVFFDQAHRFYKSK